MASEAVVEAAKELDRDFAPWLEGLSHVERAELRLYQSTGYLTLNPLLRDETAAGVYDEAALASILTRIETIDGAIEKGQLRSDVTVFRGVRSYREVFGVPDLPSLEGGEFDEPGFFSTSIDVGVAAGMTVLGADPLVLELTVPAGQHAAWLSLAGDRKRRSEFEILLPRRSRVRLEGLDVTDGTPTVEGRLVA